MPLNTKIQGYIIIILAVFTWSFSEIIVKLLQQKVGPLTLSFFRFFIGSLFMLIILFFKKDLSGFKNLLKENWKFLLISSCFALGISNVIYFIGVRNTQANIAATIYSSYPIWITIYSILLLQEKNNLKLKFIGLGIGIFGVIILMTNLNIIFRYTYNKLYKKWWGRRDFHDYIILNPRSPAVCGLPPQVPRKLLTCSGILLAEIILLDQTRLLPHLEIQLSRIFLF